MILKIKRAYETPSESDGTRILVDRLWPRGLSAQRARIDDWSRDLAPSTSLRRWFDHHRDRWDEFKRRYFAELDAQREQIESLQNQRSGETVTLIYAAKDTQYNNAVALREYLQMKTFGAHEKGECTCPSQ